MPSYQLVSLKRLLQQHCFYSAPPDMCDVPTYPVCAKAQHCLSVTHSLTVGRDTGELQCQPQACCLGGLCCSSAFYLLLQEQVTVFGMCKVICWQIGRERLFDSVCAGFLFMLVTESFLSFFASDVMELFALVVNFVFSKSLFHHLLSPSSLQQVLLCSLLSYSKALFKELWQHQGAQGTAGMCSSFHFFTPSPRKGLCMQSNALFQEGFACISDIYGAIYAVFLDGRRFIFW